MNIANSQCTSQIHTTWLWLLTLWPLASLQSLCPLKTSTGYFPHTFLYFLHISSLPPDLFFCNLFPYPFSKKQFNLSHGLLFQSSTLILKREGGAWALQTNILLKWKMIVVNNPSYVTLLVLWPKKKKTTHTWDFPYNFRYFTCSSLESINIPEVVDPRVRTPAPHQPRRLGGWKPAWTWGQSMRKQREDQYSRGPGRNGETKTRAKERRIQTKGPISKRA